MPSGNGRWTELSSENERVIKPDDPVNAARPRWSELASSGERLVDAADPLFPSARGSQGRGSQRGESQHGAGLRLVAGAA
jgi:hypothetical protein